MTLITLTMLRTQKMNHDTGFCMEAGQVKSGEDKEDTFIKMLQENIRITQSVAYGVASQYPSVMDLVLGFRRRGEFLLQDLEVIILATLLGCRFFADMETENRE